MVYVENRQNLFPIRKRRVQGVVRSLGLYVSSSFQEVAFYFVSKREISSLHARFFNDPTPTDCISFPLDDLEHGGEGFLCPEIALAYAEKSGQSAAGELLLYLVHSFLHLHGYRDSTPSERQIMRKMEKRCMEHLKAEGLSL